MTAPITGFQPAQLIDPLDYWYLQLSGTAQGVEVAQVLEHAVSLGLIANGTSIINSSGWQVSVTDKNGVDTHITTGDYIVIGVNQEDQVATLELVAGADSPYAATPQFSSKFTAA